MSQRTNYAPFEDPAPIEPSAAQRRHAGKPVFRQQTIQASDSASHIYTTAPCHVKYFFCNKLVGRRSASLRRHFWRLRFAICLALEDLIAARWGARDPTTELISCEEAPAGIDRKRANAHSITLARIHLTVRHPLGSWKSTVRTLPRRSRVRFGNLPFDLRQAMI